MKHANEEYVMWLRVSDTTMDDQFQSALVKLFNSNKQSVEGPQGHSQCLEGSFVTTNEDQVQEQDSWDIKFQLLYPLQLDSFSPITYILY